MVYSNMETEREQALILEIVLRNRALGFRSQTQPTRLPAGLSEAERLEAAKPLPQDDDR